MKKLLEIIKNNQFEIVDKLSAFSINENNASMNDMVTLAWDSTIQSLISIIDFASKHPEDDYAKALEKGFRNHNEYFDAIGVGKQFKQGSKYGMSLALLKYQKRCLLDLVNGSCHDLAQKQHYEYFLLNYFDRLEMNLANEWEKLNEDEIIQAQKEKIRFLKTLIQTMSDLIKAASKPFVLLDNNLKIVCANNQFLEQIITLQLPGCYYLRHAQNVSNHCFEEVLESIQNDNIEKVLPWVTSELYAFCRSNMHENSYLKLLDVEKGTISIFVGMRRLLKEPGLICMTIEEGDILSDQRK